MNRPPVRPAAPWHFPAATTATLANGLRVRAYHRPGQYVAAAGLVLDLPLTEEPADIEGVATITQRVLDEGTATHPDTAFADTLESLGAALSGGVGYSASQIFLDVPEGRLAPALALLAEAVREPQLKESDVQRHLALRLAEIDQSHAHSSHRAGLAYRGALIDPGFRSSRPAGGTSQTVRTITTADVRDWHNRYTPAGALLVLCADFSSDPLAAADAAFGSWTGATPQTRHERPMGAAPRALLIHRPGAVQADVRLGTFGADRHHPQWAELQMANYAMGGAFLSRLNRVLREDRGYTYGVRLANTPMRHGGLLAVQGSFRTEVAVPAIDEARTLLDLSDRPFTGPEITDGVNFTTGVTPLRYATADGVAEQVVALAAAGLEDSFVDKYAAALRRVTPESATAAMGAVLDPDALTLVMVGDADILASRLAESGWDAQVTD